MRGHDSLLKWAVAFGRAKKKRALRVLRGTTADAFYTRCLQRGDLAFDIGANRGAHTSAMVRRGARVVALEPQRALVEQLERDFPDVTVLQLAAGPEPGMATLATSSARDDLATLSGAWTQTSGEPEGTWDGAEQVRVTTVDALIDQYGEPVMLKVDTEGFEDAVFAGLSVPVQHILFEVHANAPEVARRVLARLASLSHYEFRLMAWESWAFGPSASADQVLSNLPWWGDVYARRIG